MIIRENIHTDRCRRNTRREKCCAKRSGKEVKIQEFMYRETRNVEPEMYDYTSNNWSHWNSNGKLKEKFENCTRKTLDRFTTKDSCISNITRNTESTAAWSLKPERWGHRWFKRSTRKKRPVTYISYNNNSRILEAPYKKPQCHNLTPVTTVPEEHDSNSSSCRKCKTGLWAGGSTWPQATKFAVQYEASKMKMSP